jgi:hypothetical protein
VWKDDGEFWCTVRSTTGPPSVMVAMMTVVARRGLPWVGRQGL